MWHGLFESYRAMAISISAMKRQVHDFMELRGVNKACYLALGRVVTGDLSFDHSRIGTSHESGSDGTSAMQAYIEQERRFVYMLCCEYATVQLASHVDLSLIHI